MKNLLFIIFLASSISFMGCIKDLEIDPVQSIDASVALETAEDMESALIGAYGIMHGGSLYGTNLNLVSELLGSDSYCQWRGTFQSYRQIMNKNMTVDNAEATRTWIDAYRAINIANNVLANLSKVSDIDVRAGLEAEARFIRGALHFELVRLYAKPWDPNGQNTDPGVPLAMTGTADEAAASIQKPRDPVAAVYTQVINDLMDAEAGLPDSRSGTDRFRGTTYTAKAFLVRVYMQQSRFVDALPLANEIIESGNYTLNAAIASTFSNKFTNETIFELYNNDQNNAGTANDGLTTFYASLSGIGRSDVRALVDFVSQYEDQDERLSELIYVGVGRRPGSYQTGKWTAYGQNIPVIRLSEMLLARAECNLRLNSTIGDTPLNDVNLVRNRARASLLGSVDIADVLKERNLELCFEGSRIHDIKRVQGSTGTYAWDDPKLIFPIPEREIRANKLLAQNEGY